MTDNKYLFLDIDGVLNTEKDWKKSFVLRKELIDNLCTTYPNARIILTSSWKNGFVARNSTLNSAPIKELESMLSNNVVIIGKTEGAFKRDEQIENFLNKHPQIRNYIVIDDDISEYNSSYIKNKHFRLVDSKIGFI